MSITINSDLTVFITLEDGLLECRLPNYNPETQVSFTSVSEAQNFAESILNNPNYFSQVIFNEDQVVNQRIHAHIRQARRELLSSAWSIDEIIRDTSQPHHLVNTAAFDTYREALQTIINDKSVESLTWPTTPTPQWSDAPQNT